VCVFVGAMMLADTGVFVCMCGLICLTVLLPVNDSCIVVDLIRRGVSVNALRMHRID